MPDDESRPRKGRRKPESTPATSSDATGENPSEATTASAAGEDSATASEESAPVPDARGARTVVRTTTTEQTTTTTVRTTVEEVSPAVYAGPASGFPPPVG